jgi:hypothetical protein
MDSELTVDGNLKAPDRFLEIWKHSLATIPWLVLSVLCLSLHSVVPVLTSTLDSGNLPVEAFFRPRKQRSPIDSVTAFAANIADVTRDAARLSRPIEFPSSLRHIVCPPSNFDYVRFTAEALREATQTSKRVSFPGRAIILPQHRHPSPTNPTNFARPPENAAVTMNIFRIGGDLSHLASIFILLHKIQTSRVRCCRRHHPLDQLLTSRSPAPESH